MQIFSDAIVEEQQKHTNNQTSNNNSIPITVTTIDPLSENVQQKNIIKRHTFTNAVPKPASTAPLFSTPENRSVNLAYSNGSIKNGRKRNIKEEEVIVLENINLDSVSQSTSTAFPQKPKPQRKSNKVINKPPIKQSPPLQVSIDRPSTANLEQFLNDNYLSQECSSTHSDDNSILSPVEATESMIRTIFDDGNKAGTWQTWNNEDSKSPRPDLPINRSPDEKPQTNNPPPEKPVEAEKATLAIDPHDINLNENHEVETKKSNKASCTKDPESGLTIDTVKRRRLCSRYDHLFAHQGITHRLIEVPNLTNIQVAGLLRRSRNRPEMADISESVWNFVFEEKRRVEDRSYSENIITSKEFNKKLNSMKADDADEETDTSDIDDYSADFESGFLFEEVQNETEEDIDVHEFLQKECEFYELRRNFCETDRWLCLLKRSLMERRSRAKQIAQQITKKPTLQFTGPIFGEDEDNSQHCARCMPVKVLNRPKIVKQDANNFERKVDSFNFVKQSDNLATMDDDLSQCLEELSLQLKDEDFSILANVSRQIPSEPRIIIENMSELRRKEARARAKKASERLINSNIQRGVGRPPKHNFPSKSEAHRKHLKRKSSCVRERLNSNEVNILQENSTERKSFEEQLHRLSSVYVYSEISIPEYRPFDLDNYISEKLVRKVSSELDSDVAGPSNESNNDIPSTYDPMFFARIHHAIEFPKLNDEEIRRRRREKWMIPIPEYQPFLSEKYQHEDPNSKVLMYCKTNSEKALSVHFHPGLITDTCQHIHREPKIIGLNNNHRRNHQSPTPNSSQE